MLGTRMTNLRKFIGKENQQKHALHKSYVSSLSFFFNVHCDIFTPIQAQAVGYVATIIILRDEKLVKISCCNKNKTSRCFIFLQLFCAWLKKISQISVRISWIQCTRAFIMELKSISQIWTQFWREAGRIICLESLSPLVVSKKAEKLWN